MNTAKKYRKKPVVIEAVQLTTELLLESLINKTPVFEGLQAMGNFHPGKRELYMGYVPIRTLEGVMRADNGDWIIKGVKGELYPCKSDIFEATYEAVEQELKRPTIDELEKILQRTDLKVALNPDGSLTTVKVDQPQTSLDCVGTDGCKASTPVIKPK